MANGIVLNIDTTKSEFQNPMVQLRQGDGNYQSLSVTVTSNGEPFDLTGWTTTFMGTTAGGFKIIDDSSIVTNALQGEFTYTPTKAWGQDQGEFKNAYFKFTKEDETASGASFRVNVLDAVDLTAEEAGNYISVVDVMIDKIKTDMNNKLADTQKTLSDTQSQATTVQGNVNNLNNNVNELKAQNNNIKTSDNTWTGTNAFNKKIIAPAGIQGNADRADVLNTRYVTFTDFADVAGNMIIYSGNWRNGSTVIANSPVSEMTYIIIEVVSDPSGTAGIIRVAQYGKKEAYYNVINGGKLGTWFQYAVDSNVVHNTGNETIAGDKTLTGSTTFTQPIIGSLKTRAVTFSDFNDVAKNMVTYSGNWFVGSGEIINGPVQNLTYATVEVIPGNSNKTGIIRVIQFGKQLIYYAGVNSGVINNWHNLSQDETVVHNTKTETVAGNKTFTGDSNFSGTTTIKTGNYGLRVTTTGIQKTSDGGTTWTNI